MIGNRIAPVDHIKGASMLMGKISRITDRAVDETNELSGPRWILPTRVACDSRTGPPHPMGLRLGSRLRPHRLNCGNQVRVLDTCLVPLRPEVASSAGRFHLGWVQPDSRWKDDRVAEK